MCVCVCVHLACVHACCLACACVGASVSQSHMLYTIYVRGSQSVISLPSVARVMKGSGNNDCNYCRGRIVEWL